MIRDFSTLDVLAPAENLETVTPSNTVALTLGPSRALFVGTGGDVTVISLGGQTATLKNVADGTKLDVRATHVKATGTTATDIVSWR